MTGNHVYPYGYRGFESHPLRQKYHEVVMPHPIRITVGDIELDAELNDSQTAGKIREVFAAGLFV